MNPARWTVRGSLAAWYRCYTCHALWDHEGYDWGKVESTIGLSLPKALKPYEENPASSTLTT